MDKQLATRAGTLAGGLPFLQEMLGLLYDLRWMLLLCICLTLSDLIFGIEKAKKKKEQIRKSSATRRTMNKIADYVCWVILAGVLGQAIGEPLGIDKMLVASIVLIGACVNELDSISSNYAEAHGLPAFSFRKFLFNLIKRNNADLAESLDETLTQNKDQNQDKDESTN